MKTKQRETPRDPKPTVLILDANPAFLKLLKLILSDRYQVAAFNNPVAATLWLEEGHHPDLIISDVPSPAASDTLISPHLFLQNLKNSGFYRHTPHILLSPSHGYDEAIAAMPFGVDAVFRKPFNPLKLKDAVTALVHAKPVYATA